MLKRFCVILLLSVALLYKPVYSQDLVFSHIDWTAIENNVTSIELNLNQLETDNQKLQLQLTNALSSLTEQQIYSANQALQLNNLNNSLQKQEKYTKIWKTSFFVSVGVIVSETVMLIIEKRKN